MPSPATRGSTTALYRLPMYRLPASCLQAVLVASDVAARGLDVPAVETVIHYQLPASADTYIHRCRAVLLC